MRKKASLVLRLAVLIAMTLGVVSMMGMSASAQASTVNCNGTLADGTIVQGDCQVELVEETGICQVTLPDGTIAQGQNDSACEALEANTCPSQVILDDGSILQITCDDVDTDTTTDTDTDTTTDTDTDTTTDTDTDTTTDDVGELPDTGVGVTQEQDSTSILLLVVAGMLAAIGAVAWQQRHSA